MFPNRVRWAFEPFLGHKSNLVGAGRLRAQLQTCGDVSAVIESATGFSVFLAEMKTATALRVAILTIPKPNYEQWLSEQEE